MILFTWWRQVYASVSHLLNRIAPSFSIKLLWQDYEGLRCYSDVGYKESREAALCKSQGQKRCLYLFVCSQSPVLFQVWSNKFNKAQGEETHRIWTDSLTAHFAQQRRGFGKKNEVTFNITTPPQWAYDPWSWTIPRSDNLSVHICSFNYFASCL